MPKLKPVLSMFSDVAVDTPLLIAFWPIMVIYFFVMWIFGRKVSLRREMHASLPFAIAFWACLALFLIFGIHTR